MRIVVALFFVLSSVLFISCTPADPGPQNAANIKAETNNKKKSIQTTTEAKDLKKEIKKLKGDLKKLSQENKSLQNSIGTQKKQIASLSKVISDSKQTLKAALTALDSVSSKPVLKKSTKPVLKKTSKPVRKKTSKPLQKKSTTSRVNPKTKTTNK